MSALIDSIFERFPKLRTFAYDCTRLYNDLIGVKKLTVADKSIEAMTDAIEKNLSFSVDNAIKNGGFDKVMDGDKSFADVYKDEIIQYNVTMQKTDEGKKWGNYSASSCIIHLRGGQYTPTNANLLRKFNGNIWLSQVGDADNYLVLNGCNTDRCFSNCSKLKKVYVESISLCNGDYVNCSNLEEIYIRGLENLLSWGKNFMANCPKLKIVEGLIDIAPNWGQFGLNSLDNCERLRLNEGKVFKYSTTPITTSACFVLKKMFDAGEITYVCEHLQQVPNDAEGVTATISFNKFSSLSPQDQTRIDAIITSKGWERV